MAEAITTWEGSEMCHHPGCPSEIRLTSPVRREVSTQRLHKVALALGWLITAPNKSHERHAYCPGCRKAHA